MLTFYIKLYYNVNKLSVICFSDNRFREVLANFFNRPFVRKVICAHMIKYKWDCDTYSDAVSKYCDVYRFKEMIEEWLPIAQKTSRKKSQL